jgi:beta-glucosidase/6-phospho-beta-glucosidase/beta-galactosidase
MFATGIECSYPTIDNGRTRRDLLEECGHYERWREDLGLIKELGSRSSATACRTTAPPRARPLRLELRDEAMGEIRRLELTPILDLLHFGVPDWLGNFQNPELPVHFAAYADAVAERYPWVRFYTPVNEIFVTARISAKDGQWNEQLKTDKGLRHRDQALRRASILANHAIAARRPDCVIVQSESAEYIHEAKAVRSPEVTLANKQRFISLDLLYARPPDADICMYLQDNGLTARSTTGSCRASRPATRSWATTTTAATSTS